MARLARDHARKKPWKAEVRVEGDPLFLGYFKTKKEAVAAETSIRRVFPDGRK